MYNFTKVILFSLLLSISLPIFAQDTIPEPKADQSLHHLFANIFTGGYYGFHSQKPNSGFEISTALIGYQFKKSDKLKFTLIYDVTHTTSNIHVLDTAGNNLPVSFVKGSEYTAFLKMAELKWTFTKHLSFSAGQLLNEQYLTVQDKFWGHRYVLTTMQELYRMANPADFGMRIEYKNKETFAISLGANNGNGPFYHQDSLSVIEYTSNLEIYLIDHLLLKAYTALTPATFETTNNLKTSFSGFIAYQQKSYKIGIEYSYTNHPSFLSTEFSGVSAFVSVDINSKINLFTRYDYVDNSPIVKYGNMALLGIQYQPEKNLFLSLNYRYWLPNQVHQLYFNIGAKF